MSLNFFLVFINIFTSHVICLLINWIEVTQGFLICIIKLLGFFFPLTLVPVFYNLIFSMFSYLPFQLFSLHWLVGTKFLSKGFLRQKVRQLVKIFHVNSPYQRREAVRAIDLSFLTEYRRNLDKKLKIDNYLS